MAASSSSDSSSSSHKDRIIRRRRHRRRPRRRHRERDALKVRRSHSHAKRSRKRHSSDSYSSSSSKDYSSSDSEHDASNRSKRHKQNGRPKKTQEKDKGKSHLRKRLKHIVEEIRRNCLARRNREAMEEWYRKVKKLTYLGPSDVQRGHSEPTVRSVPGCSNPCKSAQPIRFIPNADSGKNLESSGKDKGKKVAEDPKPPKQVPPPKEPTFSCPICMGPFVEETSTECGHIFCKECIKMAIQVYQECPTCRKKLKLTDTYRIYLPKCD